MKVKNLTVQFGAFKAVDQISFQVQSGEIFGFLGANGAGKTTTIRVLCGLLNPTGGEVLVSGHDLALGLQPVKERVGYMSQKFTLYDDLTVRENLEFAASLRKIPAGEFHQKSQELLNFIAFDRDLNTFVKDLPGGIKQQVSLACALLHSPEIIFLDEPTAGVTPASRARFWALIRKLADDGKTVFVTTHYMDEAEQCDRIALMRDGKIIALDTPSGLKKNTFPEPLFELVPQESAQEAFLSRPQIEEMVSQLRKNSAIYSIAPYGSRFHVVVSNPVDWKKLSMELESVFDVHEITPSLEDVFIRLVEGKKL